MNFFILFLVFERDEFQGKVNQDCCRRHVKGEEATSNTKIVVGAAAAALVATSSFAATIIIVNTIDQTFMTPI